MEKNAKVTKILQCLYGLAYVPFGFLCFLLLMVSEAKIGATNPLYIAAVNLFCGADLLALLLYTAGLFLSVRFRRSGRRKLALGIQLAPLVIFGLNMLLVFWIDRIPAVL